MVERCRKSSSKSACTTTDPSDGRGDATAGVWPEDPRLDGLIFDAIRGRSGRSATDLATILERVDSVERWVPTFEELDGGLSRLSGAGRIREIEPGRFIRARPGDVRDPYKLLTQDRYESAVQQYRVDFAADAVRVMRSRPIRGVVWLVKAMYVLTRGRFGLRSGGIDINAVAVSFAAEGEVVSAGGRIGDVERGDGWLRLPIEDLDPEANRAILVASVGEAVRRAGLTGRRVILRFDDGEERDAITV